ncbi:TonB-dependent receptor plug domain-containing protein [Prolixibacteraceae bacterium]|nr:TonB-dependent receptor plug domain-containing protein [Prolixibacteraceae bacterium]
MKSLFCHLILLLLLCPFVVLSQNNIAQDTLQIGSVTITHQGKSKYIAGKTITRISSQDIRQSSVDNFGEMIIQKSAIYSQQQGRGGAMYLSIRGMGRNHTEVLWNGIPLNSPMYGTVDFSLIPTNIVDQASIYFGGSATGYSTSNIGGTVELRTFPNLSDDLRGGIKASIGSFHTYKTSTNLSYKLAPKLTASSRLFYSSSLNDFKFINTYKVEPNEDGTAWINPEETNDQGDWLTYGLLQEFFYEFNDHSRLSVHYWGQSNDRSIPMLATDESNDQTNNKENNSSTESHRGSLRFNSEIDGWRLTALSAINFEKFHFWYKNRSSEKRSQDDKSSSTNIYNRFNVYKEINPDLSLHLEAQYNHMVIKTADQIYDQQESYKRDQQVISAKVSYQITPILSSSLTLMNQWNGGQNSGLTPFLGINLSILNNRKLDLTANINRNYRFPTLNDMYAIPGGNPELQEEDGWAYNIGAINILETEHFTFHNHIDYYHSEVKNWIELRPSEYGYWISSNKEKVVAYGISLKHETIWNIQHDFLIKGSFDYNYSRTLNRSTPVNSYDNSYNKQLPYIPEHTLTAGLSTSYHRWEGRLSWIWNSMQYSTSDNDTSNEYGTIDGYNVANLDISYHHNLIRTHKLIYTLSVYNLTNQTYESMVAQTMPGANFLLSINYNF